MYKITLFMETRRKLLTLLPTHLEMWRKVNLEAATAPGESKLGL